MTASVFSAIKTINDLGFSSSKSVVNVVEYLMNKGPSSILTPPTIEDLTSMPKESIPSKSLNFLQGVMELLPDWGKKLINNFLILVPQIKWYLIGIGVLITAGVLLKTTLNSSYFGLIFPPQKINNAAQNNETDKFMCVVCMENVRELLFKNCGHFIVCRGCVPHLNDTCPICRTEGGTTPVYFS